MDFGEWRPDLPPYGHDGLVTARNVYPAAIGYKPIRGLSSVTGALGETWKGGGSFIDTDGTTVTLAGANGGMYAYLSGSWTLKQAGSYSSRWAFAQWGSFVIGTNGATPVKYTISTATGATLGGTPPAATMIAVVRDFVFLAGDSAANRTVYWSGYNDAEGWTVGTNQCDKQMLPDGGGITGLAGGEYGLVFQDSAIHRFSYVGTPLIFQRDKISDGIGCVANGALATFGRMTFFLSPRGFYVVSDGGLQAIGDQKVNDTFWASYSRADVTNSIRCVIDPKRTLVIWSMPDRLWIYNWTLQRWTDVVITGLVGLSTGINASVTLEGVDTLYPSGIDSVPYSLDDPIFLGGDPLLTVAKSDNTIYAFGGSDNLAATIETAILEPFPGSDTRIWSARIEGDMTSGATMSVDHSLRLGDSQTTKSASTINTGGKLPIRVTGRFIQPRVEVAAGTTWSYVKGIGFEMARGGRR